MSAISSTQSAQQISTDYMQLLITQLQNQNPLEPLSNEEMAGQLAQLSQLEQTENMNQSFSELLQSQLAMQSSTQKANATNLLGKEVTYSAVEIIGDKEVIQHRQGQVDRIDVSGDKMQLYVGEDVIDVDSVTTITV